MLLPAAVRAPRDGTVEAENVSEVLPLADDQCRPLEVIADLVELPLLEIMFFPDIDELKLRLGFDQCSY